MNNIQKVYLIGLGAIGSSYADLIHRMESCTLKVIADQHRIKRYTQKGISINGRQVCLQFIEPGEDAPPADLILIAVKYHQLRQAINDIRKFVGDETIILSLLNGITSEEIVGQELGMDKLLYSFVVDTDAVRNDTKINFSKVGTIVFGEKINKTHSSKVDAVSKFFDRAGIPYRLPENMIYELWWKFGMNVGLNQTSAIMRAPYGVFQRIKEAKGLMKMACLEVVRLSEKAGVGLQKECFDQYLTILDSLSPQGKTSMLQDVEANRKTEVEIFAGTVIELGRKYDVPTPVNDLLYRMIRTIEQTYPVK